MSIGHQIAMSLRAAYLVMHRQSDAALAADGVTADQFVLLAVLVEEDRITQQTLVRRTWSDPNTIRAMLVLMETRGLVLRERHPTDRRARIVVLTRKGRRTYERLRGSSEGVRRKLEGLFLPDETRILIDLLVRITTRLAPAGSHPAEKSGQPLG